MAEAAERKPPQALEAEAAILGAMILDNRVISEVVEVLGSEPDHFYLQPHRLIYDAIVQLDTKHRPVDVVTLSDELKRRKELDAVGGTPFLSSLLDNVLTTAHSTDHAKLVLEKSAQRRLIETATDIVRQGYSDEANAWELLDDAEQRIFGIRQEKRRRGMVKVSDLLAGEMERIEEAAKSKKLLTGLETGFHELDELTSGLQAGDLVIMAGRPSMGKTALALNIAVHASVRGQIPVAVFSLEMSTEALVQRLLCSEAAISMNNLRRGMLNKRERTQLVQAMGALQQSQIYLDDSPGLNPIEIRARARRLASRLDLGAVVVDYIQLMQAAGGHRRERSRQQEISDISRMLKEMAMELKVPVIALSQLSRAPEARPGKKPQLSDLRESGAIEQDADVVLLLFRQEHYEPENEEARGQADVNIAKQRHGRTRTIKLTFLGDCMRFENPFLPQYAEPSEEEEEAGEHFGD